MAKGSRREFLTASSAAASTALSPVRALAAAVNPVRIRDVELFPIEIPASPAEVDAGVYNRFVVVKVVTDTGVTGYAFEGPGTDNFPAIRQLLVGKELFAIENHLRNGLMRWGSVEHALWDAIGKIGNQPVYRLLGGGPKASVKTYLTCVWSTYLQPDSVSYDQQADMALKVKRAGFKGMKIQAWRPHPMHNVEAVATIRAAVGPDFAIMVDRTAHAPGQVGQQVWDFKTGLQVARSLEKLGVFWLEEPFARDDYQSPARLAEMVSMPITGGEGYVGMQPFQQCLVNRTYDILQPDARHAGGILTTRKIAILAEAYHVPCILHGSIALPLAGWLQASFAIGAEWQEIVSVRPPSLPQQLWAPGLKVLKSKEMFTIQNGAILAPEYPGLGLDVDEDALERFRTRV